MTVRNIDGSPLLILKRAGKLKRMLGTNALCIVSEYGRPSLFISLTCNAYWVNITD